MRRARNAALLLAAAGVLTAPAAADAKAKTPHLSWIRCYGKTCTATGTVFRGGNIKLGGRFFRPGMRVIFKASTSTKQRTVKTQFVGTSRLIAHVPANARSGSVYLTAKHGVRTNKVGPIRVKTKPRSRTVPSDGGAPSGTAFDGTAMWIWNLPRSDG